MVCSDSCWLFEINVMEFYLDPEQTKFAYLPLYLPHFWPPFLGWKNNSMLYLIRLDYKRYIYSIEPSMCTSFFFY